MHDKGHIWRGDRRMTTLIGLASGFGLTAFTVAMCWGAGGQTCSGLGIFTVCLGLVYAIKRDIKDD